MVGQYIAGGYPADSIFLLFLNLKKDYRVLVQNYKFLGHLGTWLLLLKC